MLDDTPIQKKLQRITKKYDFCANTNTTPPEYNFLTNANGARAFMMDFLCGVERVMRFVKVHLHYIFRNLKKDKQNIDGAPPREISADAHEHDRF